MYISKCTGMYLYLYFENFSITFMAAYTLGAVVLEIDVMSKTLQQTGTDTNAGKCKKLYFPLESTVQPLSHLELYPLLPPADNA